MRRLPEMMDLRGQHPAPGLAIEIGNELARRSGKHWLSVVTETYFGIAGCLDAPAKIPAGSSTGEWHNGERSEPGFGYLRQTVVHREPPNGAGNRLAEGKSG